MTCFGIIPHRDEFRHVYDTAIVPAANAYEPVYSTPGGRLVWDYGLVIRGPHPNDSSRLLMVLAGRSSLGTEAACMAATSPQCVEKLAAALRSESIELEDHSKPFCAVVSISTKDGKARLGGDPARFRVEGVQAY